MGRRVSADRGDEPIGQFCAFVHRKEDAASAELGFARLDVGAHRGNEGEDVLGPELIRRDRVEHLAPFVEAPVKRRQIEIKLANKIVSRDPPVTVPIRATFDELYEGTRLHARRL